MVTNVERYVGRDVEMIYIDRHGRLTQRKVRLLGSSGGLVRGFCYGKRAPRAFKAERILAVAVLPERRRTG